MIQVFLVAGLISLLTIVAGIFNEVVREQWFESLQMLFTSRPLLAPTLVVLLAGLIALLTWSLAKLKERK